MAEQLLLNKTRLAPGFARPSLRPLADLDNLKSTTGAEFKSQLWFHHWVTRLNWEPVIEGPLRGPGRGKGEGEERKYGDNSIYLMYGFVDRAPKLLLLSSNVMVANASGMQL
ncbi:unnamed protein product [Caretta caretta]